MNGLPSLNELSEFVDARNVGDIVIVEGRRHRISEVTRPDAQNIGQFKSFKILGPPLK